MEIAEARDQQFAPFWPIRTPLMAGMNRWSEPKYGIARRPQLLFETKDKINQQTTDRSPAEVVLAPSNGAGLACEGGCLGAIARTELSEDASKMGFDSVFRQE
jgi:hypothetical protein